MGAVPGNAAPDPGRLAGFPGTPDSGNKLPLHGPLRARPRLAATATEGGHERGQARPDATCGQADPLSTC
jgi:hypothetical protein